MVTIKTQQQCLLIDYIKENRMKKLIPTMLVFLVLFMPIAIAQYDWGAVCIGNELIQNTTITVDGDTIPITKNTTCPHGCDAGRRECTDYSGTPGTATPLLLFLAVEAVAVILLVWAFAGEDNLQKLISALTASILLFPLGLMSFNVLVDKTAMVFEWLGWLNFGLAFIGVAIVIYAMILHFKEDLT